jgi:hypothetical protein
VRIKSFGTKFATKWITTLAIIRFFTMGVKFENIVYAFKMSSPTCSKVNIRMMGLPSGLTEGMAVSKS